MYTDLVHKIWIFVITEPWYSILRIGCMVTMIYCFMLFSTLPALNMIALKRSRIKKVLLLIGSSILIVGLLTLWRMLNKLSFMIGGIPAAILFVSIVCKIISHDSYGYIVYITGNSFVWVAFAYYYAYVLNETAFERFNHPNVTRMIIFLVFGLVTWVINYFVGRNVYKKASNVISGLRLMVFMTFIPFIYTLLFLITLFLEFRDDGVIAFRHNIYIISILLGTYIILTFVMNIIFKYLFQFYREKEEMLQTEEKMSFWKSKIDSQNDIITLIKKHDHDQRHHNAILLQLIENEDFDGAKKYLVENMHAKNYVSELVQYCNNYTINCLLTFYLNMAHKENIKTDAQVYIPEKLNIEEMELGGLYANVIENAIEACRLVEEERRSITIRSRYENGALQIKIDNSCSFDLLASSRDNGEFVKTKKVNGGLGLKNVMEIVNKYKGILDFEAKDGIYTTRIILYINQFDD